MKYSELKNERVDLKNSIPLERPFTILFEPSAICNFRCPMCYYQDPEFIKTKRGLMEFDDFCKIADDLREWGKVKVIRLIGFGEPLINKHVAAMVKYLKFYDLADRVETTTNGSLMTPHISTQLIESGLDYIRISIYDKDIRENILELKKLRGNSFKPFIYVKKLASQDDIENKRFLNDYDFADEVAIEKHHAWLSEGNTQRTICPQPFKMLSIRWNGDVICCDPDWKNNTKVGNAITENIYNIWNGDKLKAFQKLQLDKRRWDNESCKHCTFLNDNYVFDNMD